MPDGVDASQRSQELMRAVRRSKTMALGRQFGSVSVVDMVSVDDGYDWYKSFADSGEESEKSGWL